MTDIKFLDLKANYEGIKDEILDNIQKNVLDDTSYINGPSVAKFESKFADYIGVNYCVGVGNGTDALEIALQSLGITTGDEVITQANTFISTALAIRYCGATIVLVDHNDDDFMINVDEIESKITLKTKCILPVHLYGHCANMDKIMQIAKKHNLFVVEDVAQSHGALYKGKRAGSFGDLACFSFYPGKNLGAYGDGGAIITNNEDLYNKVYKIHNLGSKIKYHHEINGRNSRLDSIQAEILNTKLKYLNENNNKRLNNAKLYNKLLNNVGDIKLQSINDWCDPVYHLYVIRTSHRDELQKYLKEHGVETGVHYPIPLHKSSAFSELNDQVYLNTDENCNKILSLPMYPELSTESVKKICETIEFFF